MTTIRDEFPALWQFLGAYLHQDWQDEYSSTQTAFRDFLDGEPRYAELIPGELTAVLDHDHDETALQQLVLDCGSFYLPSRHGIRTAAWLSNLLAMCPGAQEGPQ